MTSPARQNHHHATHNNEDIPPPAVPQPNFVPANIPQVGPIPQPFAWQPPPNFPHQPLLVGQYPGLPRNVIAHVQRAHALPPVDYNAHLNEQMNAAQNNRRHQRDVHRRQDRDEIRQQVQAELRAAGMQPPQQPHIPNEPIQPAPPVYGAIHYEGAVGPHNFDNPLRYFAPNPAPPVHAPPEPDYHQFNNQFQHHFQEEQLLENERIRQAEEAFHQQQLQQQFQQQEAECLNREARYALEQQQHEAERMIRQDQDALRLQQHEAERMIRQDQDALRLQQHQAEQINQHDQDVQRAGQQEEEHHCHQQQRVREQEERLQEALGEYDDPASQEMHDQDEERRLDRLQREAEDQHRIDHMPACNSLLSFTLLVLLMWSVPIAIQDTLHGQVSLPPFPPWPPELQQAYTNRTFISKIRQYNSALAFTSVGINIKDRALQGSGPNAFRIHGSLHHLMGSLIPPEGIQPSYAQLYIYDPEEATNIHATRPGNEGLDRRILRELHDMLY
ncbi:hypothetical protein EV702DRAFT_1191888 [Suillus placidus]|uniref:Uncharacterized protein n=1 Tax=Suillus placidus TaxID=48579 RepID=A0A9P7D9G2_9AGAM|nr:hypothetical protein EV702DRAFT_1191888 [Suillus placidus]